MAVAEGGRPPSGGPLISAPFRSDPAHEVTRLGLLGEDVVPGVHHRGPQFLPSVTRIVGWGTGACNGMWQNRRP